MENLQKIIAKYPQWKFLEEYLIRIPTFLNEDFGQSVENLKALLESIGKEICIRGGTEFGKNEKFPPLMVKAVETLGFKRSDIPARFSGAFANIVTSIGFLRNDVGSVSHGMDSRKYEKAKKALAYFDPVTKEFLMNSVEAVCIFFIQYAENSNLNSLSEPEVISEQKLCENNEEFDAWWDEEFGEFQMGDDLSFNASQILYQLDNPSYESELKEYLSNQE